MFSTSVKQICNEYLIKFSENQSPPKLENRKASPCSPCAPNLFHVLVSRIPGYHNLCSPALTFTLNNVFPQLKIEAATRINFVTVCRFFHIFMLPIFQLMFTVLPLFPDTFILLTIVESQCSVLAQRKFSKVSETISSCNEEFPVLLR